ncbi:phosphate ABC transporter permease subunit PstC [Roseibacillus ishigakijimensis]|uniref:Phosphate transport system permease protein n=1 Tax=Roseibacillus ishigakijimensis TaxID=454146 RepID=A0A934RQX4_9BACT|nr:phosphate ABC transporter permease subunit PstC [Roseibacillus ishigakijimensis]MBK1833981.1 phosphate ABC transporter permease subunit PstC [Roseibacillus ishigakijimensis]
MSEQSAQGEAKAFRKKAGFRFMGLGLQDMIRYFFGGNAMVAIIVLLLISAFLAKEAFFFFPRHLEELRAYRETGQEYVGYMDAELKAHRKITSAATQAYNLQLRSVVRDELALLEVGREVKTLLREEVERERDALAAAEEQVGVLEFIGGEAYEVAKAEVEEKRQALQEAVARAAGDLSVTDLTFSEVTPEEKQFNRIKQAMVRDLTGEDSPWLAELEARIAEKQAAAEAEYEQFGTAVTELVAAQAPLEELWSKLRTITSENRDEVEKARTAPRRKKALEDGAKLTDDPERKAEMLAQAAEVDLSTPEPEEMTRPVYDHRDEHQALRQELLQTTRRLVKAIPDEVAAKQSNAILEDLPKVREGFEKQFKRLGKKAEEWSHDEKIGMGGSILTFFLGTEWVTNSSWNDVYGLLPLFSGSCIIAIIAIVIAVPFSVASAIYVNQIASPLEQNLIKPTIEFIQAIPSIVLGFFGIVVLGDFLREMSQWEFLAWLPGFPMQERLNALNAGLLLAFMSIPTIFTLAEDALNNVPKAYRDASLALGSTRLQTIFKVVVPTALSGIVAAVLLGFGRIIGETMVVLLVAGNKIAMPEWGEGLGVLTDPTHTMTGIIAQETGEVEQGSLHWRALFMVGMVLFTISLVLNSLSQEILKRFGNK